MVTNLTPAMLFNSYIGTLRLYLVWDVFDEILVDIPKVIFSRPKGSFIIALQSSF